MNKSVVFFGTEAISAVSLQALIEDGWTIEAVVTKPDTPRGRHSNLVPPLVKSIALEHNIPVLQPDKVSELLTSQPFDTSTAVLVSYGKIIPQSVLDLFPTGIVNVHPSLLPKYRGPTPFQTAILHGDSVTGVSLMKLVQEMDAGPVYVLREYALRGEETAEELGQTLAQMGAQLLIESLPGIIDGSIQPTPQDDSQVTYCQLFTKEMGSVDWSKPAQEIEREVRAYYEWPKSTATLGNQTFIIKKAHVVDESGVPGTWKVENNTLIVFATEGAVVIDELQPQGGKPMSAAAFLAGHTL